MSARSRHGCRWNDRIGGAHTVISCRVLLARRTDLGDTHNLDGAVVDVEGKALATLVPEHLHRSRVVERHAERAGEAAARVAHHCEEAALLVHALVLSPSVHHRAIVDAVDDHLVDAERLEVLLRLKVARHLPRRSGGRESARKADNDHFLAGDTLGQVDL